MSKRVKYIETGHEGVVNDKVAAILEGKAVAEILGDTKPKKRPEAEKPEAEKK